MGISMDTAGICLNKAKKASEIFLKLLGLFLPHHSPSSFVPVWREIVMAAFAKAYQMINLSRSGDNPTVFPGNLRQKRKQPPQIEQPIDLCLLAQTAW